MLKTNLGEGQRIPGGTEFEAEHVIMVMNPGGSQRIPARLGFKGERVIAIMNPGGPREIRDGCDVPPPMYYREDKIRGSWRNTER